jgi:hypothetical protein
VGELLEILRIDARGGFRGHCCSDMRFSTFERSVVCL